MTRLARGDVAMSGGILTTNGPQIAARIDDVIVILDRWRSELVADGGPDPDQVAERLTAARDRLESTS